MRINATRRATTVTIANPIEVPIYQSVKDAPKATTDASRRRGMLLATLTERSVSDTPIVGSPGRGVKHAAESIALQRFSAARRRTGENPPVRALVVEAGDERRHPGDRARVVPGHELVDERHRGAHPDRQRLLVDLHRARVDPDQPPRLQLQAPDLGRKHVRVAAVPAVADDQDDRAARQAAARVGAVELAERAADAC